MLTHMQGKPATEDGSLAVSIAGIATAVPANKVTQSDVARRAQTVFPQFARRESLFTNTGIESRYACMPEDWYLQDHGWPERTEVFRSQGLDLLEGVSNRAMRDAGLEPADIDVIVTNTVTGLAIPSLDAMLMNRIAFRNDVERLPIFGIGCGGGVAGMARARQMARGGRNVLFLTLDLCSLCLRLSDPGLTMFVACALFGDGAAGVVLTPETGTNTSTDRARITATGEHFWHRTEHIMGWDIADDGFGIVLSPDLPNLLQDNLTGPLDDFLHRHHLTRDDLDGYLLHPGGSKVLDTVRDTLHLDEHDIRFSREVLRKYGNMSSATVLFVLHDALKRAPPGRYLLAAFGPGFSAYFAIVEL